jgi:phosphatidylserine/phosphatidylglycerophosphate/cardiolipin synthase-like enzyme
MRSISSLHAKTIIIDDHILYYGNTNWYRYSLEKSLEITMRGDLSDFNGVMKLINEYWNEARIVNIKDINSVSKVKEWSAPLA